MSCFGSVIGLQEKLWWKVDDEEMGGHGSREGCLEFGRSYHAFDLIAKIGLDRCGLFDEPFKFFMKYGSFSKNKPNSFTYAAMLAICGTLSAIQERVITFDNLLKRMALVEFVGTAIIGMYSVLGEMDDAGKQLKGVGTLAS
ncbi:hypothetical protein DITRI_Ditri14bG0067200 [Diplodiscus trichospermus]